MCVGSVSTPEPNPSEPQRHRSSGDAELCAHGPKLLTLPPDASSAVGEAKPPVRRERWWCGERVQLVRNRCCGSPARRSTCLLLLAVQRRRVESLVLGALHHHQYTVL